MATLTSEELLQSIWMALRRIEDNLALPPAPLELPPIQIPEPDLAAIVTAVNGLKPGPTAEEIAAAIAATLTPTPNRDPVIDKIVEALQKLDFRMQAQQNFGGGQVSLTPQAAADIGEAVHATTTTTAVTVVAATTATVELGANRAARSAMTVYNEPGAGNGTLYMKFGAAATTTSYSNQLAPGDYWESSPPKYGGLVTATWNVAQGRALVTEFLA